MRDRLHHLLERFTAGTADADAVRATPDPQKFYLGVLFMFFLLVVFTLGQAVVTAVAILASREPLVHQEVMELSALVNAAMATLLGGIYTCQARWDKVAEDDANFLRRYRLMLATILLILCFTLFHLHLLGSQNSLYQVGFVAELVVVSWFLRWREAILLFALGNLALLGMVLLEVDDVLAYAPLLRQGNHLARTFLDTRFLLGNGVIYLFLVTLLWFVTWQLRVSFKTVAVTNQQTEAALRAEIERHERTAAEREVAIQDLRRALEQVKTLRGLVPICAQCKKIRDDKGYWRDVEIYIMQHSEADFTHGLCPECSERYWREFEEASKSKEPKP